MHRTVTVSTGGWPTALECACEGGVGLPGEGLRRCEPRGQVCTCGGRACGQRMSSSPQPPGTCSSTEPAGENLLRLRVWRYNGGATMVVRNPAFLGFRVHGVLGAGNGQISQERTLGTLGTPASSSPHLLGEAAMAPEAPAPVGSERDPPAACAWPSGCLCSHASLVVPSHSALHG